MYKPLIYLAGPISRVTYRQATKWRTDAANLLAAYNMEVRDPMYGKEAPEGGPDAIIDQADQLGYLPQEVFLRDMKDISECDALLVNLEGFTGSIGTPFEMGRAWSEGIPIVVYNAGDWITHPFSTAFTYIEPSLEWAATRLRRILL